MRVISLLPSATEILAFIGADDLLVGRSHECDTPTHIRRPECATNNRNSPQPIGTIPALTRQKIPNLGPQTTAADIDAQVRQFLRPNPTQPTPTSSPATSTTSSSSSTQPSLYELDLQTIADLRPDLIITQDLCDVCSIDLKTVQQFASTLSPKPQIVSLNPTTIEAVFDDILTVGRAVQREHQATAALLTLRDRFFRLSELVTPFTDGPSVAFLEWTDPLFTAGHWTPQLIERAGAQHPLNPTRPINPQTDGAAAGHHGAFRAAQHSFTISPQQLIDSRPDRLIVCPCGLDLNNTHQLTQQLAKQSWWNQLPAVRNNTQDNPTIALVDGNKMFNRPGPALVDAYAWLVSWINNIKLPQDLAQPTTSPDPFPWRPFV